MHFQYYFEDFSVGLTIELGTHEVSRDEMIEFASRYDPQSFHTDEEAAKASLYDGLIASGFHTCAIAMRLMCEGYLLQAASLGSPGVDNVRWLKPVRPGDTLRGQMTVLESRASISKPDRGTVRHKWEIFNQRDEPAMTMEGYGMFKRRNPGA